MDSAERQRLIELWNTYGMDFESDCVCFGCTWEKNCNCVYDPYNFNCVAGQDCLGVK